MVTEEKLQSAKDKRDDLQTSVVCMWIPRHDKTFFGLSLPRSIDRVKWTTPASFNVWGPLMGTVSWQMSAQETSL